MKRFKGKSVQTEEVRRNLIDTFETAHFNTGLLGQMKELMIETLEQVKEKPMVWGSKYYESYKKLVVLEDVYAVLRDRYQVFIKEEYPEQYKDYRWNDLERAKNEVGYPLNDEEALFSNEKWSLFN